MVPSRLRRRARNVVLAFVLCAAPVTALAESPGAAPAIRPTPRFSLVADVTSFPRRLWEDARALPSLESVQLLSLGGGWAFVSSEADWDRTVRRDVARNPDRLGDLNDFFSVSGHPLLHVGAATMLWAGGLWSENAAIHEFALDLFNAAVLTDVSNYGLKQAFDSDRPNGEAKGFPSGHTSSSFAFASVVQSHFGLVPGLVAYGLAGAIGWHRVDAQHHELSDVLAGAAIGYLIGRSVGGDDTFRTGNVRIVPYSDLYGGGTGIAISWRF